MQDDTEEKINLKET